jgi:hypothetical protein
LKYNEVTFLASKVFIVDLQLVNLGDRDFPEFKFNISLPSDHNIIASICEPPDHAHAIENTPAVTPESWAKEMGFTLRPFNARDSYALRLYIHVGTTSKEVTHIVPTTEESVRFIDMPAISKQLEEAVRLLGPVPFD